MQAKLYRHRFARATASLHAWPSPPPESHSGRFFVLTLNCRLASIRIRTKTDRPEQV